VLLDTAATSLIGDDCMWLRCVMRGHIRDTAQSARITWGLQASGSAGQERVPVGPP